MEATDAGTISATAGMISVARGDISAHEVAIAGADNKETAAEVLSLTP